MTTGLCHSSSISTLQNTTDKQLVRQAQPSVYPVVYQSRSKQRRVQPTFKLQPLQRAYQLSFHRRSPFSSIISSVQRGTRLRLVGGLRHAVDASATPSSGGEAADFTKPLGQKALGKAAAKWLTKGMRLAAEHWVNNAAPGTPLVQDMDSLMPWVQPFLDAHPLPTGAAEGCAAGRQHLATVWEGLQREVRGVLLAQEGRDRWALHPAWLAIKALPKASKQRNSTPAAMHPPSDPHQPPSARGASLNQVEAVLASAQGRAREYAARWRELLAQEREAEVVMMERVLEQVAGRPAPQGLQGAAGTELAEVTAWLGPLRLVGADTLGTKSMVTMCAQGPAGTRLQVSKLTSDCAVALCSREATTGLFSRMSGRVFSVSDTTVSVEVDSNLASAQARDVMMLSELFLVMVPDNITFERQLEAINRVEKVLKFALKGVRKAIQEGADPASVTLPIATSTVGALFAEPPAPSVPSSSSGGAQPRRWGLRDFSMASSSSGKTAPSLDDEHSEEEEEEAEGGSVIGWDGTVRRVRPRAEEGQEGGGSASEGAAVLQLVQELSSGSGAAEGGAQVGGWVRRAQRLQGAAAVPVPTPDTHLNPQQRAAVKFALDDDSPLAVIQGPPGTGKTGVIVEIIRRAVRRGQRVLASAPSNAAVDNLLERLSSTGLSTLRIGAPERISDYAQQHSFEVKVQEAVRGHPEAAELASARALLNGQLKAARQKARQGGAREDVKGLQAALRRLGKKERRLEMRMREQVLGEADVVLSTATGAQDRRLQRQGAFDLAVVDEAGQATEPSAWIPVLRARRAVLVGDAQQLPPTLLSLEAAQGGLSQSLLERAEQLAGGEFVRRLTVQYRMNAAICSWASEEMYSGCLVPADHVATRTLADLPGVRETVVTSAAMVLLDTRTAKGFRLDGCEEQPGRLSYSSAAAASPSAGLGRSLENPGEAEAVAAHVERLLLSGVAPEAIAVQSPYAAQVELLRARLALLEGGERIEVASVDSFQGREADAVILSMVRSNDARAVGFLSDARRLNVAVTRARRHFACVCDTATVQAHPFIARLLRHMRRHGTVEHADPTTWHDADATGDPADTEAAAAAAVVAQNVDEYFRLM